MRINVKDKADQTGFGITIDPANPPAVVRPGGAGGGGGAGGKSGGGGEVESGDVGLLVSLDWDRAFDDELHLRHCPVCRCKEFYVKKPFPQLTGFALLIFAAVIAMVLFGFGQLLWAVVALVLVLAVDLLIYIYCPKVLTCYSCGSEYRGVPIRRGLRGWENAVGEKYRDLPDRSITPKPNEPEEPTE